MIYAKDLSVEEIITRLKKKEKLYNDVDHIMYFMFEGVICRRCLNDTSINVTIRPSDIKLGYFKGTDKLVVSPKKIYLTRGGDKVLVTGIEANRVVYGTVLRYKTIITTWDINGRHHNKDIDDDLDLIMEISE